MPSLPATIIVEVLVTSAAVWLIVATALFVYVLVVYTVTRETEVDDRLLDELPIVEEETRVVEELTGTHAGTKPWPATNG